MDHIPGDQRIMPCLANSNAEVVDGVPRRRHQLNKIIDTTQFYTLMFTAFLLNITMPISLKWWKPYYPGFKQLKLFDAALSRPTHPRGTFFGLLFPANPAS